MIIELWKGERNLYVCIIENGCKAIRIFDVYEGKPQDGGREDVAEIAAELAEDANSWKNWRAGAEVPSLVYTRGEIRYGARLIAYFDGETWREDGEITCSAAKKFIAVHKEVMKIVNVIFNYDDDEEHRFSGLLEE